MVRPVPRTVRASYATPYGEGEVIVSDGLLAGVTLPITAERGTPEAGGHAEGCSGAGAREAGSGEDRKALIRWKGELEAYFRGERLSWAPDEVGLDGIGLGEFERKVYRTLLCVPPGTTVGYGELAEMAGYHRAARAVGSAMAKNPIPIVVPCHRVIRADGTLGNYGDDPEWKPRLLEHETAFAKRGELPRASQGKLQASA